MSAKARGVENRRWDFSILPSWCQVQIRLTDSKHMKHYGFKCHTILLIAFYNYILRIEFNSEQFNYNFCFPDLHWNQSLLLMMFANCFPRSLVCNIAPLLSIVSCQQAVFTFWAKTSPIKAFGMNQTYERGSKKDLFFDWSVEISCVLFNNARICQKAPLAQ